MNIKFLSAVFYNAFIRSDRGSYFSIRLLRPCFMCLLGTMLLFFSLVLTGCSKAPAPITMQGFYFDTVVSLTFYETDSKKLQTLQTDCAALMQTYENTFSRTVKGSDVWNINHSNGNPVTVSDETIYLLKKALYYAELSEGLVDPTIGTLSTLWNFEDKAAKQQSNSKAALPNETQSPSANLLLQQKVPSDAEISQALSHVNYHAVVIDGNQVTLTDADAILDLGFIAKGYIADLLKDYLLSQGIRSAIINLGGNVLTIGSKPDGSPYQVGIQEPFSETGTALMSLPITNQSLVSSGNYERYFFADGVLYHHILSPKTGYPADSGLSQVSIISDSSVDGDALSTLCFLLGYEKGKALIEGLDNTEAVFVTKDGEIYCTDTLPASTSL